MNKNMDFLPEDYFAKKAQRRTNGICLTLFVLVVAAVAAGFAVTEQRQRSVDQQAACVSAEMNEARGALEKLESLEKTKKQMMVKARLIASLLEPVPRSLVLATVTNKLPEGVTLTGHKLETKELKPEAPKVTGKKGKQAKKTSRSRKKAAPAERSGINRRFQATVELIGVAETDRQVAKYMENLSRSALLTHLNLSFSKEYGHDDRSMREFKLTGVLKQDIRASEKELELLQETAAAPYDSAADTGT